jgi:putative membrane protein
VKYGPEGREYKIPGEAAMSILLTWIANSLAICIVAYFLKGVSVASMREAFIAGALLSLINATVRPVLVILTLPLTIVSLGLFYFLVTAFCLWLTAYFVPGFAVHGFLSTVVASILVSVFSTVIHRILATATDRR